MISSGRQIAVYAFGEPVDMRKSFNTLSALVVASVCSRCERAVQGVCLGELALDAGSTDLAASFL